MRIGKKGIAWGTVRPETNKKGVCEAARSLLLRIKAWSRKSADKELRVLVLTLSSLIAYYYY